MSFLRFLKQHYEKLILVTILVAAAALLAWQVMVIQDAQSLKVEKVTGQVDPPTDYQKKIDPNSGIYKTAYLFSSDLSWIGTSGVAVEKIDSREKALLEAGIEKDMMTSARLTLCPHCAKLIPVSFIPAVGSTWVDSVCPQCGKNLKPMRKDAIAITNEAVPTGRDENSNGVPDKWEIEYNFRVTNGMNELDQDHDGDGFTAYEEFFAKTNPRNAKSHPPFVTKLQLTSIDQKYLGNGRLRLNSVTYLNNPDKAKWEIDFILPNRRTTKSFKIGTQFMLGSDKFELTDITFPEGGNKTADYAHVIIKRLSDGMVFTCRKGQPIMEPNMTVSFIYLLEGNREIQLKPGAELSLGTVKTGAEKYTLVSADKDKSEAVFKDAKGKTFKVGLQVEGGVPEAGGFRPRDPDMIMPGGPIARPPVRRNPDGSWIKNP